MIPSGSRSLCVDNEGGEKVIRIDEVSLGLFEKSTGCSSVFVRPSKICPVGSFTNFHFKTEGPGLISKVTVVLSVPLMRM